MIFASISSHFVFAYLGRPISYYNFGLEYSALLLLLLAVLRYRRYLPPIPRTNGFGLRLGVFLVAIVLLFLYGCVARNPIRIVLRDTYPMLLTAGFLAISRYDEVWEDLEKPLIVMFWIGALMMLVSWSKISLRYSVWEETAFTMGAAGRGAVRTVAYRIQGVLDFWPLLFALGYMRRRWNIWKILGMGSVLMFLAVQVRFQKRAPMGRGLAYLAAVLLFIPVMRRRLKVGTAIILLVAVLGLFTVVMGGAHYEQLIKRFEGTGSLLQSTRIAEARTMLSDLGLFDYLFGRGMGGHYAAGEGWTGAVLREGGGLRRTGVHMGALVPLLKGGLFLCAIYYSFFLSMFRRKGRRWYDNTFNTAAMTILPVYAVFLLVELPPSTANAFAAAIVGMACARMAVPAGAEYVEYEEPLGEYAYEYSDQYAAQDEAIYEPY
jgi:hypothetical protein